VESRFIAGKRDGEEVLTPPKYGGFGMTGEKKSFVAESFYWV